MNLDLLNQEYNSFWNNESLQAAVENLRQIDNYISDGNYDTFLLPYTTLLKTEYLLGRYAIDTNQSIEDINISYVALLNHFKDYLKNLINEIIDYQKKLEANKQLSLFEKLIQAGSNFLDNISQTLGIISNPIILTAGIFFIIFLSLKKGK